MMESWNIGKRPEIKSFWFSVAPIIPLSWIPTEADASNGILSKTVIVGHSARGDVSKL